MGTEDLKLENERLRKELAAYRQRELQSLQDQLAEARAIASHYRDEAVRNANVGRQIHLEAQQEIDRLRTRVQTLEQISSQRPVRTATPQ